MRVLILGSGGREHALAWKLSQSSRLTKLWCAPGNPGTAAFASSVPLSLNDNLAVVAQALALGVDLVVVGPEAPLVNGVADALRAAGVRVFGPNAGAAQIEGSKAFSKQVMKRAGIPTADYRQFENLDQAVKYAQQLENCVVKADGLAAGKGVVVADSPAEAVRAIEALGQLEAGKKLLIEERLNGPEVSVIALCDGKRYLLMPPARDHKRVNEGDLGANTGGMGAYCASDLLSNKALASIGREVIEPALVELERIGRPFSGALYAGLMLTPQGIKVIEFNCRLGDPETQVLMLQMDPAEDLLPLLVDCARGELTASRILNSQPGVSIGVVLAARGYPESPQLGDEIRGLGDLPKTSTVFQAGTRQREDKLVTAGGRVLTVCARGDSLEEARMRSELLISRLGFEGMHYRRDIGVSRPS